ncbi:FadR/GntR family transcriptional regulator [Asticcacaulis sp. BYS171W]|uniref:FadR/GntR family transcriptional regulator n=1 Tax=Asticcacaulis aquaticus TaxID=2984212 RepID=A0ABT5HYZ9_9CAUL|nr:FadR/GntR family transcriptional regulator [Asticcacaulis aquaticus]MDC7685288.1 FadR/GntR family transcriptional regulator [Asticcacaulis aquaticus]
MSAEPSRLYRRVADSLVEAIKNGDYAPGSRLPVERELSELFSVSRPTVREAMIALEILNLVEIRHGSGVYVVDAPQFDSAKGAASEARQDLNVGPFELIETRMIVEGGAAAVAATLASSEDIADLEDILNQQAAAADLEQFEELDRQFHLRLAQITNNATLIAFVEELWNLRKYSQMASATDLRARGGGRQERDNEHHGILDAIKRKDGAAAQKAMHWHLERVREYLLEATETEALENFRRQQKQQREALVKRYVV